jgi:hypothetical protein
LVQHPRRVLAARPAHGDLHGRDLSNPASYSVGSGTYAHRASRDYPIQPARFSDVRLTVNGVAAHIDFPDLGRPHFDDKDFPRRVRAIRAF